jgi:hypothetical protein
MHYRKCDSAWSDPVRLEHLRGDITRKEMFDALNAATTNGLDRFRRRDRFA